MIRIHQSCEIKYGHFSDYVSACEEMNAIARARGWKEATIFAPISGVDNRVVVQFDYGSLAEFQAEQEAFYADAEAMKVLRSTVDWVVQGSSVSEILEPAPHLA